MPKSKLSTKDTVKVLIKSFSHDGRGIAHIDGKTVFVAGALPGEEVRVELTKIRSSFDEGIAREIITASPQRRHPKCQHFGICGGCSFQHFSSEGQIQHKEAVLLELLQHQAHATPKEILPPITADIWGYRHKARLGVRYVPGKNKVLVGFREKNSRYLADLLRCEILHPSVGERITDLSHMLYQLQTRHQIAQIEVCVDDHDTALIIRHLIELPAADIAKLIEFAQQFNFKLYLQPKGMDSVHLIYPSDATELMNYALPAYGLKLYFHPWQFTQVNPAINQQMIARAIELLQLTPTDSVLDLFCGIGNFTLPIATKCLSVVGVEGDETSVKQARYNSQINQLPHSEFYVDNLFLPPFKAQWSQKRYAKLLIDPPRAGAKEIIPHLSLWQPKRIVYVSCNPATLARDTALLLQQGYQLEKAGVIDMFAHTQHAEAIAVFQKLK